MDVHSDGLMGEYWTIEAVDPEANPRWAAVLRINYGFAQDLRVYMSVDELAELHARAGSLLQDLDPHGALIHPPNPGHPEGA